MFAIYIFKDEFYGFKDETDMRFVSQNKWTQRTQNAKKDVQQQEFSFIASGNEKHYRYFGRQFGSFLWN